MVATVGSIAIDLSANTAKFISGFKASATTVERESARMSKAIGGIGNFVSGLAGGAAFAGLASLSGALNKAKESLTKFEDIGNVSRLVGLTAKSFQELSFAALETDVSQETLNSSLEIFAKNAGLAKEGAGAMYSGLLKLNPELLRAVLNTKDQEERLRLVADAMSRMTSATEKAALATAVFGKGGVEMVRMLEGGSAALDAFAARAAELGILVSDEDIKRYGEAADEIERLAFVTDQNLSIALANAAPLLIAMGEAAKFLSEQVRETQDEVKELGDVTSDFFRNPSMKTFMDAMFGKGAGVGFRSVDEIRAGQANAGGLGIDKMLAGMGGGTTASGGLPRVTRYGGDDKVMDKVESAIDDGTYSTDRTTRAVEISDRNTSGYFGGLTDSVDYGFKDLSAELARLSGSILAGSSMGGSAGGRQTYTNTIGSSGYNALMYGAHLTPDTAPDASSITEGGGGGAAAINVNVVVKPILEGQRLSPQSTAEIKQAASAGANAALRAYHGR